LFVGASDGEKEGAPVGGTVGADVGAAMGEDVATHLIPTFIFCVIELVECVHSMEVSLFGGY